MNAARRLSCIALIFAFCLLCPSSLFAYYDDVHYALTYYLARAVGYTPNQAHRIASADVMTDYDFHTEPVQGAAQAAWVGGATVNQVVPGSQSVAYPTKEAARWQAQIPRIDFHAFMDCYNYSDCLSNPAATAVIPQKRTALEQVARESGNPGSLLHFVQDLVPHAGYPSDNGHWTAVDASVWNWAEYPLGATTDYLSYPGHRTLRAPPPGVVPRNKPTIDETINVLAGFMEGNFNGKPILQKPRKYTWDNDIEPGFQATIGANRDPSPSFWQAVDKAKGDLTDFYDAWKGTSAPNLENAITALNGVLTNKLKAKDQIPPAWLTYDLNRQGVPEPGSRNTWVLWGNLKINIKIMKQGEEIGRAFKSMTVKVIQAPTFQDEEEEVILKKTFSDSDPILLENVPVGELIVELNYDTRKPDRKNIRIEGPEQEMTLTLDLDKEDEQTTSLDELLKLRDKMKELEKKSNEYALEASNEFAELGKSLQEADAFIGSSIDGYTTLAGKIDTWTTQIAELEAAIQKQQTYLTEVQTGKQKTIDAETAAREKDCPPSNVIEEGTEDEKQAAVEKAKTNAQSIDADVQAAEAGAKQARTAADELVRLQSLSEKLSVEIQSADVTTLTGFVTSATTALDGAQAHIDRLTDLAANLESVKNEADEIMRLVQAEVKKLESAENIKDRVKEITAEIDASYNTIVSNYEKWKDIRLTQMKKSEELRAQIAEMDGKIQALDGKIHSLVVPTFEGGSAGSDAEVADTTFQSVKTIAERVKDCPETLAGIELKQTDRITKLDIEFEQYVPLRSDGTGEFIVNALVTVEAKEQVMVTCEGSHIAGHETGSVGGYENYAPETYHIPLGRGDFRLGDEVTVSCYIDDPHKKVTVTKRIGADGAASKLLAEIKSLEERAKSIKDSADQVSDSARDKAKDLSKDLDRALGEAGELDASATEYLSAAHSLPLKKDQAASRSASADAASALGNSAAAEVQQNSGQVCGILDAVNATDSVPELQNHLASARTASSSVQTKEQEFNSALAQAQNESQNVEQLLSEVKNISSEKGSGIQSGLSSLNSSLENAKSKTSSLESQLKMLADKKPEMEELKNKAQAIAGQADQMEALEISKEDRRAIKEIRKSFEKIEGHEEDLLESESKALEKSSGIQSSIADLESRIAEIQRKAAEADGLLAAGGDVSIIEEFSGRAKSAAENLSVQAQTVAGQSSQCATCLANIEALVAQKTSPEAQVARHDCSGAPNTQAQWNAAAQTPACFCIDGYEPDPAGVGCRITVGAAIAQKDCSGVPGSRALWDESTRQAYCGCIQGYKWNETQTACIPDIAAQMAAIDCSPYPGAAKAWDPATEKATCSCAAAGLEWNNSGTACRASAQAQVANSNCSHYPGSVPVWDGGSEQVMCQCPGGTEPSMDGGSCVPYGQGRSRANQPPPTNPFDPNALTNMMNTWNQGVADGEPPPNTGTNWGNWGATNAGGDTGIPPGGMLPGLGSTSGSSSGGGQPAGFTGFGGTSNTGQGWTNTGYVPPPPTNTRGPSTYTGSSSPGVDTSAGDGYDPCAGLLGQGGDC